MPTNRPDWPVTYKNIVVLAEEICMYKNLSPKALGVSGRQSELIELALTYGFRGLDVDVADLAKRAKVHGVSQAIRFLESAKIKVGGFELPVNWLGNDTDFQNQLKQLDEAMQVATAIKATRCLVTIAPANDERSFQDNFEFHRQRLTQVAEVLAKSNVRLGIGFNAVRKNREGKTFQFIHQAETMLQLLKNISAKNVGLLLDTFHWTLGGGAIDQLKDLKPDQIIAVRLADYPTSADPEKLEDSSRKLPLEEGSVDCAAIVSLLTQKKYDGPVTLYPHPSGSRGSTREFIVQRAAQLLDELWRNAGVIKPKPAVAAE
jgi:sugar phosphate isomerase/epimerase